MEDLSMIIPAFVVIAIVVLYMVHQNKKIERILRDFDKKNDDRKIKSSFPDPCDLIDLKINPATPDAYIDLAGVDTQISVPEKIDIVELTSDILALEVKTEVPLDYSLIHDKDFGDVPFNELTYITTFDSKGLPNVYFYPEELNPYLKQYAKEMDVHMDSIFREFILSHNIKYNAIEKSRRTIKSPFAESKFAPNIDKPIENSLNFGEPIETHFSNLSLSDTIVDFIVGYFDPHGNSKTFEVKNTKMFISFKKRFGYDIPNYEYFLEWYNGEIDAERKNLEKSFDLIPA